MVLMQKRNSAISFLRKSLLKSIAKLFVPLTILPPLVLRKIRRLRVLSTLILTPTVVGRLRSLRALCSRSNVMPTKLLSLLVAVRVMLCSARRMLLLHFRWLVFWITRLLLTTTYRLMTRVILLPVFLMVA